MDDVLDIYQMPYNQNYPVICMDEKPYELLEDARLSIPMKLGKCERVGSIDKLNKILSVWENNRNVHKKGVNWQFKTIDARI